MRTIRYYRINLCPEGCGLKKMDDDYYNVTQLHSDNLVLEKMDDDLHYYYRMRDYNVHREVDDE